MLKFTKQHLYILFVVIIISLPNLLLGVIGQDSIVASSLKKIVFLTFSLAIVMLPLLFLKPKYYALIAVLLSPIIVFELYSVQLFKAPSSDEATALLFYTNSYETKELLKSSLKYVVIFLALFMSLLFSAIKLKKNFKLEKSQKLLIATFVFIVFIGLFIRDFKIAKTFEKEFVTKVDLAYSLMRSKVKKTFPTGNFLKLVSAKKGIKSIKNYQDNIKNFKYNAFKKDTIPQQEIYVLVIGETARKASFSLCGYDRNTNPLLSKKSNITSFNNVKSAANLTSIALPFIMTRATPNNLTPKLSEPAIMAAFKESGFKTYWLTNQAAGLDNVFAFYSRLSDYYKNIAVSIDVAKHDEALLPELDIVLNDKSTTKKFIVIHTLGSHFRYNYRYPDNFEAFKPTLSKTLSLSGNSIKLKQENINSYDNSILYTDYILSQIIDRVDKTNSISYMYYISDHGENLYDDDKELLMHGFVNPSKYEIEVPLIIWNSNAYNDKYPSKTANLKRFKDKKITTTNAFHTLLDMANITYKEENLQKSFVSKEFDTIQKRTLLSVDNRFLELD